MKTLSLFALILLASACSSTARSQPAATTNNRSPDSTVQSARQPDNNSLTAIVDKIAMAAIAESQFPGLSIAVARGDKVLVAKGYGSANLELEVPVSKDTVFRIGSVTKQFTAVAILLLIEKGKLKLDDPIAKFLPDYPKLGRQITVGQLLTHTSGIPNFTSNEEWRKSKALDRTADEIVALFRDLSLNFEPGESFDYSNSGYFLLGVMIEKASGEPYAEHIDKLLAAHGLVNTRYCFVAPIIKNRAEGYRAAGDSKFVNDKPISMSDPFAAGALCSTALDLVKWQRALENGEIVNKASLALMQHPGTLNDGSPHTYGLGVFVGKLADKAMIQHGGAIDGFNAQLSFYPAEDVTIAVLGNNQSAVVAKIEEKIARALFEIPPDKVEDLPLSSEQMAAYIGTYVQKGIGELKIYEKDGKLAFKLGEQPETPLLFQGDATFAIDMRVFEEELDLSVLLRFNVVNDRATKIIFEQAGLQVTLKRRNEQP